MREKKRKLFKLYNYIITQYAFFFLILFSLDKLAKHASKNVFALFSSSNLLSVQGRRSPEDQGGPGPPTF